ncbi:MAG: hypothetical protein ABGY24_07570 [bacterium]
MPGGSDDDGNNRYQQQLLQASRRTLALALGRGAMDLGTYDALPTEMLESPDIDLSGRIVERNDAIVTLDLSSDPQAPGGGALSERTAWPEFQNGTASALRINRNISNLSRTWIVYNKPKTPSYDHAGFLFGLGLTGQLACLTVTDLYRYLSHEHDATLVGVLLGMSASKKASMDATLTKMLFLHLPSQHPMGYPDLEIAPVVQCASLLGVGMLFQATGQRSIAEMLLGEIDSGGAGDDVKKGGGYSLMAGFGLGLVMSTGKVNAGQELYEEELGWLMKGGRKKKGKDTGIRKEEKKKGGNAVQEELLASQRRPRTLLEQGLVPQGSKEGACVALGMIWMRSMEERVFDMMALETHLDPEDVTLRVWMRCLIMWEHDMCTWLDMNQIGGPRAGREDDVTTAGDGTACQLNELGRSLGVHLALACKFAGASNETVRDYILEQVDWMLGTKLRATDAAVKEVVETAICFSVLSAAVVMTGTRDLKTFGYVRALMNCSGLYCGSVWYEVLGLGAGLLFHGADHTQGGSNNSTTSKWSFGDKPEDLAYLIIALYPSSTPDKYWSFCRHLWVLSGGLSGTSSPAGATVGDEVPEDEAMAMESVMLRIRSCGRPRSESDVQGLLDVYLSSCGHDQGVADAVVQSLVDRLLVSTQPS